MTLIVQDAFYGYFSRYVMTFVLAPASIMLVGNLIYIAVGIFKELHGKKTDRAGKDTV